MPGFIQVESNVDQFMASLQGLAEGLDTALQELVQESAAGLQASVRTTAPVSHDPESGAYGGRLRASLVMEVGTLGAELFGVGYAQYVIQGTAPHVILPQGKDALAFFWESLGGRVMFRRVQHPGTRPNDFRATGLQLWVDTGQMDDAAAHFWQSLEAVLQ